VKALPGVTHATPVLDVGCGTGAWLERLASEEFGILYGVDTDTEQFATEKAVCLQVNLDLDDDLGLGTRHLG
jgi:2-polyprenyl-3-methyl-5-hydroxy-6-metoxy-1,4-benzoquinol methylase